MIQEGHRKSVFDIPPGLLERWDADFVVAGASSRGCGVSRALKTLVCGHVAVAGDSRVCRHLFGVPENEIGPYFYRCLTGDGIRSDLRCRDCSDDDAAEVFVVCEGCVVRVEEDCDQVGWRGEPEVMERPEPCRQNVVATPLPAGLGEVVDVAAVDARPGIWLVLSRDGRISQWDCASGSTCELAVSTVPDESEDDSADSKFAMPRLHASADGRFAAVVNDFGRRGAVFDLAAGRMTLLLDGGDHHQETVPFSFAFVEHAGRTVAIHRTRWNRLDVSDPATGALLSERDVEPAEKGKPRPEHYLDYFHGALLPSPGGTRIADDGWVWHPVGIPMTWSLEQWLGGAKWEAEDGPSVCRLVWRAYRWNNPMCWLDEDHLVLGGIGNDDEAMLDGVEIFQVETGARTSVFAGPSGRLFIDDRRMYSAPASGLEIWDPDTGQRTGRVPGFVPTHQHTGSAELVALAGGTLLRWSADGHQL
jgi:hypothetical protein